MLEYTIIEPEGIVVLNPNASLTREDFGGLTTTVDAYLASHSNIHGVLIHAKSFPGWESFAGFVAHIRFVRDHHRKVERVALVTGSPIARVAEPLANHFTSAEIRHFPFADCDAGAGLVEDPLKLAGHWRGVRHNVIALAARPSNP